MIENARVVTIIATVIVRKRRNGIVDAMIGVSDVIEIVTIVGIVRIEMIAEIVIVIAKVEMIVEIVTTATEMNVVIEVVEIGM
jgi:hypothetical protein